MATTKIDKEELANRGKKAEEALKKLMTKRKDSVAGFDFQRQYDARAARGRFQPQTGDYLLFRMRPGPNVEREGLIEPTHFSYHGALEAKEVHHDFRLPNKNFSAEQIARLRRREMAGGQIVIAVFHTTTMKWRFPPFWVFRDNPAAASWDLSSYQLFEKLDQGLAWSAPEFFV